MDSKTDSMNSDEETPTCTTTLSICDQFLFCLDSPGRSCSGSWGRCPAG